ncbi:hypothetical protein DERP_006106 [Dermatophagoides pteronyssinus]|uniref:Uncharacterized protein n=1 Tax=Dermatophagoides pteronyssinus TaxID=6956 RepID=A0ABQ8JSC1_DERPT|nr:hypothetical protein DERP_006106 [Dermatophagoides pteronyssinus]
MLVLAASIVTACIRSRNLSTSVSTSFNCESNVRIRDCARCKLVSNFFNSLSNGSILCKTLEYSTFALTHSANGAAAADARFAVRKTPSKISRIISGGARNERISDNESERIPPIAALADCKIGSISFNSSSIFNLRSFRLSVSIFIPSVRFESNNFFCSYASFLTKNEHKSAINNFLNYSLMFYKFHIVLIVHHDYHNVLMNQ